AMESAREACGEKSYGTRMRRKRRLVLMPPDRPGRGGRQSPEVVGSAKAAEQPHPGRNDCPGEEEVTDADDHAQLLPSDCTARTSPRPSPRLGVSTERHGVSAAHG